MPVSFTLANDAGWRVASVTRAGHTMALEQHRLFDLRCFDTLTSTVVALASSAMAGTVEQSDASGFRISFVEAGGATVVVRGVADEDALRLTFEASLGLSRAAQAFDSVDHHVVVADLDAGAETFLFVPYIEGSVVQNPAASLTSESGWAYPGLPTLGGGGVPSFVDCIYWWGDTTRRGLYVGSSDVAGRNRQYLAQRVSAGKTRLTLRAYAVNDRNLGTGGGSDQLLAYGTELAPIIGDWSDAAHYYAARKVKLGHPLGARGKLGSKATQVARQVRDSRMFFYSILGDASTPSALVTQLERSLALIGVSAREAFATLYKWSTGTTSTYHPDTHLIPSGHALQALDAIVNRLGLPLCLYTLDHIVHPQGARYASYGLAAHVRVDRLGAPIVEDVGETPGDPAKQYHFLDMEDTTLRKAYAEDLAGTTLSQLLPGIRPAGLYSDAWNARNETGTHRASLGPARRGSGADPTPAAAQWPRVKKEAWESRLGRGVVHVSEHAADHCAADFDAVGSTSFDFFASFSGLDPKRLPFFTTAWSRYTVRFPYDVFGRPFNAAILDGLCWNVARHLHYGLMQGLAVWLDQDRPRLPSPDDSTWGSEWVPWGQTWAKFMGTAARLPSRWSRSKRLRPVPGGYDAWALRNVVTWGPVGSDFGIAGDVPRLMESVWHDEETGACLVLLSNWGASSLPASYTLTAADYPELGLRDLAVCDFDLDTQQRAFQGLLTGGGAASLVVNRTMPPFSHLALELMPIGTAVLQLPITLMLSDVDDALDLFVPAPSSKGKRR